MALSRYTLRIRARNEAGLSEAAEVAVRTGPTVPGGGIVLAGRHLAASPSIS